MFIYEVLLLNQAVKAVNLLAQFVDKRGAVGLSISELVDDISKPVVDERAVGIGDVGAGLNFLTQPIERQIIVLFKVTAYELNASEG